MRHGQRVFRRLLRDIAVRALCALFSLPRARSTPWATCASARAMPTIPSDLLQPRHLGRPLPARQRVRHLWRVRPGARRQRGRRALSRAGDGQPTSGRPLATAAGARSSSSSTSRGSRPRRRAHDLNFWLGQRFYGRADVHILDTHFVRMDGAGLGVDGIAGAGAKLGIAYFRIDGGSGAPPEATRRTARARRVNIDLRATSRSARRPAARDRCVHARPRRRQHRRGGTRGFALSVQHDQRLDGIGGAHSAWLQYAQGSAALDANFGTMTATLPSRSGAWWKA